MTDNELAATLAKAIRRTRKRAGITQAELAAALGVTQTQVSRLESGANVPTLPELARVFGALGFDTLRLVATRQGARPVVLRLT